ncbi:hypothetical protein F442_18482 [Phytophthora nicotianae P10297]|uniref:Sugar transporter SWEET1 n=1 Tax=Phytophthora nicotianae P10297 TaxID=1317064 RepID=W2YDP6_PHYNI|nr:hypothetical protein F442_18482 [Phytophthora nicotianae P10297]
MVSAFITTIKILTTIVQVAQRLSPVPDVYRVHKQRDTGVMAFMPLVAMLLCNHVCEELPLFSVCVFGDIVVALYVMFYAKYCSDQVYVVNTLIIGGIPFVLLTVHAILVAVGAIDQSRDQLGVVFGYLANITTFAVFMSPFEKIRLVIETKSSAAIPVFLCALNLINSGLWVVNGVVDNDLFIIVPNAVGVALSGIQVILDIVSASKAGSEQDVVMDLEVDTATKTSTSSVFAHLVSPKTPTTQ